VTDRSSSALRPARRSAARLPSPSERSGARVIALREGSSVAAVMAALPDPADLPPGTLVVVAGNLDTPGGFARSVLAVFGRSKTVPRAHRCSALVARGYVDVGAASDEARSDLAWGRTPPTT
jgi:hypothetical protein